MNLEVEVLGQGRVDVPTLARLMRRYVGEPPSLCTIGMIERDLFLHVDHTMVVDVEITPEKMLVIL